MADTPPWLEYQAPRAIPLSGPDPDLPVKRAQAAAALQAAAQEARLRQLNIVKAEDEAKSRMTATTPGDPRLTGEEYLATLPPELAGQVKALAEGRRPFPNNASMRSPAMQTLVAAATQYDPALDAANSATRVKTRTDFTSGKSRQAITSFNTALGHLGTLWEASQGLHNRTIPAWNAIANAAAKGTGDPAVDKFNLARHAVVDELERAFRGAGGTQTGIEEWKNSINSSQSPEQLRAAIGQGVELLNSRIQAIGDQYNAGMGKSQDPVTLLAPHAQKVFNALAPGGSGEIPPDDISVATGDTRTEVVRGPVEKQIAGMLAGGAPSKDIRDFAASNNFPGGKVDAVLAWRALHPKYRGAYDVSMEKIVPITGMNKVMASPLATIAVQAANASTGGLTDELGGAVDSLVTGKPLSETIASANLNKQMQANLNPGSALAGNVLGGAGAMLGGGAALKALGVGKAGWLAANPVKAAVLGDAAYGGAYGAGENNDARLAGAGVGAVAGLGGSALGAAATRALGGAVRGVINPAAERLRARGVPLTVGEVLGGGWKKAQDATTSVFGPGSMVDRRYLENRQALNRAAFNEGGGVVGAPIDKTGQAGIAALDAVKSQAYSDALDPVNLNLNDPQFIADVNNVGGYISSKVGTDDNARQAAAEALVARIGNNAEPGTANMTGRGFQEAYRGLARTGKERASKAYGYEVGQSMRDAQDALAGVLERQQPGAYEGFLKANKANRHLSVLAQAVKAAKSQEDQLFTPAQLGNAASQNATQFGGKVAAAMGNRPFNQLALDAAKVMSSKLGSSGTAERAAAYGALGLATGATGGAGYGADGLSGAAEGALAPAALLTLLGTRRGQALLTGALMKRAAFLQRGGQAITRNPQVGGSILAAAGVPLLDSQ